MSVEYVVGSCAACGRRVDTAETESSHFTSEGIVRYRRCACGHCWVDVAGFGGIDAFTERRLAERN